MPAKAALCGFAKDDFVLQEFGENLRAFAAELLRVVGEGFDKRFHGAQTVFGAVPLRRRQFLEQFGVARALFDEQSHGAFVSREELEQRTDTEFEREALYSTFIAGKRAAVHDDVKTWVLSLDHDVHGGCHFESVYL